MLRLIYFLAFIGLMTPMANAQKIIQATTFKWAGGQCCVSGQDYTVTLEIPGKLEEIEGVQFILKNEGNVYGRVYPVSYHDEITVFQVFMRTRVDQNEIIIKDEIIPVEEFKFAGEAFIQLKSNNKLYEIIVPKFVQLEHVAYP